MFPSPSNNLIKLVRVQVFIFYLLIFIKLHMSNIDEKENENNLENINNIEPQGSTNIPQLKKKRKRPPLQQRRNKERSKKFEEFVFLDEEEQEDEDDPMTERAELLLNKGKIFKKNTFIYKYISIKLII